MNGGETCIQVSLRGRGAEPSASSFSGSGFVGTVGQKHFISGLVVLVTISKLLTASGCRLLLGKQETYYKPRPFGWGYPFLI